MNTRIDHCGLQTSKTRERHFLLALFLNGGLAVTELAMSVVTGSTAVLADGLMNVDDLAALVFSIYSERKTRQVPDKRRTFGYGRMDALAGFVKGCLLLLSSLVVLLQAGKILLMPETVAGTTVLFIGIASLAVNFISSVMLKADACCSLNARGTYACMKYDMIGSASLIASGLLSGYFTVVYFDVAAALLIAFFMVRSGWGIFKEGAQLFLQSAPEDFPYDAFEKAVLAVKGVIAVGDIHVWSLTPEEHHLTCNVQIKVENICDCERIIGEVERLCGERFGISHHTIQPVYTEETLQRFCKAR
ncbi:MAG: cation diffusion facilitator family transporter [Candidatus Peribacteraceae bacterium]|nr:cation diffusion facilitator family transporter [Candidatus Peribacteraceae bacterium]